MMKRIRINAGYAGLVFRNGDYRRLITEGVYWLGPFDSVLIYDMTQRFAPAIDLNILLRDENLANHLTVVEVADTEIALQYVNGNFKAVLAPGRYAYWKGVTDYRFEKVELSRVEIPEDFNWALIYKGFLGLYIRKYIVEPYEKGILYVGEQFDRVLDRGTYYFWKNDISLNVVKVDLRQRQLELSGQEMLTRDKASLRVNFTATYRVTDIEKALVDVKDFEKQLYSMLQLALREFIGAWTLDELLERKDSVSGYVIDAVGTKAEAFGVALSDAGIRDVILPGDVKEIMNQVLVAQKTAEANVIMRREETASTRSLLNTAKLMEDNEMLFKLKELEYVERIADKITGISVSGGGRVLEQLKEIFSAK